METSLIVSNFGPIDFANLDLRRVNVFTGPNASGKNTLAKLLTFLKAPLQFWGPVDPRKTVYEYTRYSFLDVLEAYDISSFLKSNTEIDFISDTHQIKYSGGKLIYTPKLLNTIKELELLKTDFAANRNQLRELIKEIDKTFSFLRYKMADAPPDNNDYFYAPALADSFTEEKLATIITMLEKTEFDLSTNAALYIRSDRNVIDVSSRQSFVIEEPELNLSPTAQYELIKQLESSGRDAYWANYGLIHTYITHSPYTLSVLNNLLYADRVISNWQYIHKISGSMSHIQLQQTEDEVLRLVPSPINQYYVAAYQIADGRAESILDRRECLIMKNYAGEPCGPLADDFNALLKLEEQGNEF